MKAVDGWETKRLDEIGAIFSGSTPSTSNPSLWDGDIVWVTPNDLSKLKTPYLCDSGKMITEKGLNSCSAQLLPAGSLVMSSRAPIGYVALPAVQFCTNQGCKTIKLKRRFHPDFTYYNVLFNIDKVKNLGEGTTFAEISKTALSTVKLDFPTSFPEQAKIAKILSTVDRAIEHTEALIAKQQRIKTGLMQDLLTRGIDEHGNLRSEQTHKFKDYPLGRIPTEWEEKSLAAIIDVIDCKHYTPAYMEEGIPIIRPRNIQDYGFDLSNLDFVTERDYELLTDKHEPVSGDIVFSRNASFGVPVYVEKIGRFCIGQDVVVMRKKSVNTQFIFFALKSERVVSQIMNTSGGSTFGRIDLGAIRDLKVSFPKSEDEQIEIAARLAECDKYRKVMEIQLVKHRALKTALMQDLLTGETRVTSLLNSATPKN